MRGVETERRAVRASILTVVGVVKDVDDDEDDEDGEEVVVGEKQGKEEESRMLGPGRLVGRSASFGRGRRVAPVRRPASLSPERLPTRHTQHCGRHAGCRVSPLQFLLAC